MMQALVNAWMGTRGRALDNDICHKVNPTRAHQCPGFQFSIGMVRKTVGKWKELSARALGYPGKAMRRMPFSGGSGVYDAMMLIPVHEANGAL